MESRKMVLMNLFPWKEWRLRYREWTCGHIGRRREWANGESSIDICTLLLLLLLSRFSRV